MIYELKYEKINKHPLSFVAELPKDKILIAVDKRTKTKYLISQLDTIALAEYLYSYIYITPLLSLLTFGYSYNTQRIKIETLFDEFNVYQLEEQEMYDKIKQCTESYKAQLDTLKKRSRKHTGLLPFKISFTDIF